MYIQTNNEKPLKQPEKNKNTDYFPLH